MITQLRIAGLKLENIGPFDYLNLRFNGKYNLISGTNGIGKTTILNSIAGFFNGGYSTDSIRKNSRAVSEGSVEAMVELAGQPINHKGLVTTVPPGEGQAPYGIYNQADNLIFLNTNRDFQYKKLQHIGSDPPRNTTENMLIAQRGIDIHDIKDWFSRRYLFFPHSSHWPAEHIKNFELAKRCFSLLDPAFSLDYVSHSSFDIFVNTPSGGIPFEYLSSGFRAALALLLGIIKEIEIRRLGVSADEFSGIIMVDELDLHLHPTWQKTMPKAIQDAFPRAQIIVSSHSPHMIQSAEAHQVIAMRADEGGAPRQAELPPSPYGFKGWSVEEILEDIMGMKDTSSTEFSETMENFDDAIANDDQDRTIELLRKLEKMLHPRSPYRKIIKIQAAPVVGSVK